MDKHNCRDCARLNWNDHLNIGYRCMSDKFPNRMRTYQFYKFPSALACKRDFVPINVKKE